MRPLTEFRRGKDGRIHPTYCVRCTYKKQTEYRKSKGAKTESDIRSVRALMMSLRTTLEELLPQIDTGDEAQLDELSASFGMAATDAVRPILQWYAEQQHELPDRVFDQRHTEAE